jgi:CelD/BcsL family acetyltransferase involved in cellulose biosynthesis
MRSDLIAVSELSGSDLAAWRRLSANAVSSNPFAGPEFVLPAVRALRADDVQLLVVHDNRGTWLAALPVRRMDAYLLDGYRRVPGQCLATWRHEYCYSGTPLVSAGAPRVSLERLIASGASHTGVLVLDWLETDGPLADTLAGALATASRPVEFERFERPAVYRREAGGYLQDAISARSRKQYRRLRRRLEGEVGPLTLRDESGDPDAALAFLALESSGWKAAAGTALQTAGHGELFVELCSGFAASGRLRLLSLANDERRVAMICELLDRRMCYAFKIAFDDEYRRDSPGVQLVIAAMDAFHDSGLECLDSCADPRTAWTQRFFADRRTLHSVAVTARTPAGALQAAKWHAAAATLSLQHRYQAAGGREALVSRLVRPALTPSSLRSEPR